MASSHLILCCPFLLPPSIFPSIRVFSNESVLHIRWPKYWSLSFNISPSNEHLGLISFRMDWLNLCAAPCSTPVLPCPSPTPGACPNSCLSSQQCHPATSSSVVPFSSCLQSFPASESFPMSQLFTSAGQSIGASASASVLPVNI